MKHIYKALMLTLPLLAGLSSCLDNGDETFVLEKGDFDQLLETGWKISGCYLYDPLTGKYHSDLINDDKEGYIYLLDSEGTSAVLDEDGNGRPITWNADEEDSSINLDGETYEIESLGKELMVISQYAYVNDTHYILKYHLRNVGKNVDLENIEDPDENATYNVSTSEYGFFRRNGYGFTIPVGAVPRGDNGNDGTVAFSAQAVPDNDLPAQAPEGVQFIEGTGIMANPTNFTFASPILIDVPLKGHNFEETCLYQWNGFLRSWEVVPYSSIKSGSYARVSTISLGYFVLGTKNRTLSYGGIKIDKSRLNDNYMYYLSLTPTTGNGSTSIAFSSRGESLFMTNLPLQTYKVQITRERRADSQTGSSAIESATYYTEVKVDTPLEARGQSLESYSGWTVLDLSSIDWEEGRPSMWGTETVTYGTGAFQATLNWINYSGSTTDYDLHLTTPNGTEVFFGNRTGDGFELDRDMISEVGDCVENIYSISDNLPKGTYQVRVHHYGGATGRQYSCRVILNGKVVTVYSGITNSGFQDIYTFTIR